MARLCGAAPIPASSGKTRRHRLNRGGDRSANRALHIAVVVRMRYCAQTRAYVERRTSEGAVQAGDHPLPEALPRPRDLFPGPPSGLRIVGPRDLTYRSVLGQLLEHRLVQLGFGQQLLQPGVLALAVLQAAPRRP